mgnify:CR=1 FL=1|tara:strand:+ start:223 stop:624 length:402 start_codon:yes stop_codon:yes gene_type:complete
MEDPANFVSEISIDDEAQGEILPPSAEGGLSVEEAQELKNEIQRLRELLQTAPRRGGEEVREEQEEGKESSSKGETTFLQGDEEEDDEEEDEEEENDENDEEDGESKDGAGAAFDARAKCFDFRDGAIPKGTR